jgi:hypothetical protein
MPGPINLFRAQIIAPRVYNEALLRISGVFRKVEDDRDVIVPDVIRAFLSTTAIESLFLHHEAWAKAPYSADPGSDAAAGRIGEIINNSLLEVLNNAEAEPWSPNGKPQVTFIGVLRSVRDPALWCRIFPFCR